uniref:NADH-ubiquinone oxidoreductase chain 2 n=1 Tax=Pityophthorus pubescens TaxID=471227 RepID=A0A343A6H1_9CUCU|nr:NADH dehydrogenase subunit 2 [Pityophthorus pubescens]AOY40150.1 NADH dehydrogenase subunit 2 [Pityophthorus pubescens]
MNKFYKWMFSTTLMTGTILSISSLSWFTAWMGLELNLLSMMPLMKNFKNKFSSEATIKYFIVQAMASMILLLSMLMISSSNMEMKMMNLMMSSPILLKMGAAPLHFWLPEVVSGLEWFMTLMMLTWQKIAPMILLSYTLDLKMMLMVIILSSIIGSVLGLNQTCLRKIMAFSSINHMGWMIAALLISNLAWLSYFTIYSIINIVMITLLNKNKIFFIPQLMKLFTMNKMNKLMFLTNLMSLGGLPPFLGFLPKWMIIYFLTTNKLLYLSTILIITTLIALFMYLQIMFSAMTLSINESIKLNSLNLNKTNSLYNMISIFSLMIVLIMLM